MLALRLARGAHPLVQLRRLSVTVAAAGVGFLLLCSLGYAAAHPADAGDSAVRLLWCALPLAAAVQLATAVARTDPGTRPRGGLASAGLGPVRIALLVAVSTAAACALGSLLALLLFLLLRGDLGGAAAGRTAEFLGAGVDLPFPAVFTLLSAVPVLAGTAAGLTLRPRPAPGSARPAPAADDASGSGEPVPAPQPPPPAAPPAGLPWGVALIAAGLALGAYATGTVPRPAGPGGAPAGPEHIPPGLVAGWALVAAGLVMVLPSLTRLCGLLLAAGHPGLLRLLAGRVLQEEARRIGHPLGVLCAVIAFAVAAVRLHGLLEPAPVPVFGPLTGVGAVLVVLCAAGTVLTVSLEARTARGETTAALRRLGTPAVLLRRAAALRGAAMAAVLLPLSWLVAAAAVLPLTR